MYDHSLVVSRKIKDYRVAFFNLSRVEDILEYQSVMLKVNSSDLVELVKNESHFDIRKGTVKIHLEWIEYETINESIYTPEENYNGLVN